MVKTKEEEVPFELLNPYKKSKKKDIVAEFLTLRLRDSDGHEGIFETSPEGAKIAEENGQKSTE